jgi:hypothetical protein
MDLQSKLLTLIELRKNSQNPKENNRLTVAICRLKKKIKTNTPEDTISTLLKKDKKTLKTGIADKTVDLASKKTKNPLTKNKNTLSSNNVVENFSLVPTKKKPEFNNLEFLMQWELAPVLCDENCSHYVPSQVEDLHSFILQNYVLSEKTNSGIPFYVLAVQFLMYLVERDNCNVRVKNLRNAPGIKNPAVLEEQAIFALNNTNGWKEILQLTNKNIGSNQEVNRVDEDSSLANVYFAPISNPTNCLSVDGLGNFGELFRARAEWISKSSCSHMVVESLICQDKNAYDQVSVIKNLELKKGAWLTCHSYLLNWSLPDHYDQSFKPNPLRSNTIVID